MPAEAAAQAPRAAGGRLPVLDRRRAGVLLHLSALGPGALGEPARRFVDWIASAGFSVWQMLPVGPTGPDGSPYWLSSDSAGNASFLDPRALPEPRGARWQAFLGRSADWLDDWALFAALRAAHGGAPWQGWPAPLRDRDPVALARARAAHAAAIDAERSAQFAFDVQWQALRTHAHERGVRLFGDVPIYVAPDAFETWAHREQFRLDGAGSPTLVAGVPPDYFAVDGQLWGNPLYDWARMARDDFAHWRRRMRRQFERFDLVRIDHFRGLESHWAVPAGAASAREGCWLPTPGAALLEAIRRDLPDLPVVAEDLGEITPAVEALRRRFALPGMHVLQFAFDGNGANPHLPHMHAPDGVAYTGTHDNDTLRGWLAGLDAATRERAQFYLRAPPEEVPTALHRAALGSVARLAVLPMQDLLELGSEARFNTPGTSSGNWSWRMPAWALQPERAAWFARLNQAYGRH
ncbi:MAG: 4-alpha-glucanotransferase [Steroidobacteraceae bacterium]|jgi:4-alpha-glucanotransferase|nr:4-alpha-glucanotransferase [Steroidobacteraceae bacterium]